MTKELAITGLNNVVMADDDLIGIYITPDDRMQSCSISLKNFRVYIEDSSKVNNIPLVANNITLENYYSVVNRASELVKDSSDIKMVFITNDKEIAAYQDQRGNWWTRKK